MKKLPSLLLFLMIYACTPTPTPCYRCVRDFVHTQSIKDHQLLSTQPYQNTAIAMTNIAQTPSSMITLTNTITQTPFQEEIKLSSLSSGRYIIYTVVDNSTFQYTHYIVSEKGEDVGLISVEQAVPYISPNQEYIAFVGSFGIKLYDIEKNETIILPIDKGYLGGFGGLTWGPNSDTIAIANSEGIEFFTIADGKRIGEISNNLTPLPESTNFHESPKWSPDGEWMAYYVQAGQMESPKSPGPYVTHTSCITNPNLCEKSTRLVINAIDQLIDWTPNNHLAIFDKKNIIRIYDINSLSLLQEFTIPLEIGYSETFVWSNDEEWVAFGGGCGICIMSMKTGETRVLSKKGVIVDFWYIIP
jgi:WD40 repeat protein